VLRDSLGKEPTDTLAPGAAPPESKGPGDKVKIGDYELSGNDVAMILQEKAARDLRATQVPASAEAYEAKLPESFKLPDGLQWQWDAADPALNDIRALAKKSGWSQDDFSNVLGVYAAKAVAEDTQFRQRARAEMDKLGVNGSQRLAAVETFVRGVAGDDLGGALRQMILTGCWPARRFRSRYLRSAATRGGLRSRSRASARARQRTRRVGEWITARKRRPIFLPGENDQ
jgi:hypothetical protein